MLEIKNGDIERKRDTIILKYDFDSSCVEAKSRKITLTVYFLSKPNRIERPINVTKSTKAI